MSINIGRTERLLEQIQAQLSAQYQLQAMQFGTDGDGMAMGALQSAQQRALAKQQNIHSEHARRMDRAQKVVDQQQERLDKLQKARELYRSILAHTEAQDEARCELCSRLIARRPESVQWGVDCLAEWLGGPSERHRRALAEIVGAQPAGVGISSVLDSVAQRMISGPHDFSEMFSAHEERAAYRKARAALDGASVARGELQSGGDEACEFITTGSALRSQVERLGERIAKQSARCEGMRKRHSAQEARLERAKEQSLKRNEHERRQLDVRIQQQMIRSMEQQSISKMLGLDS